jgi:hypothetical protein
MKSLKIFLTLFIFNFALLIGVAEAQWWVSGGNVSWPHGNMFVKGKTTLNGNLSHYGNDFMSSIYGSIPQTQNIIYANQESWWGALAVINYWGKDFRGEALQSNSRLMGLDVKAISTGDSLLSPHGIQIQSHLGGDSGAVWKGNVRDIIGSNVTLTVGNYVPDNVDPDWSFLTAYHAAIDELNTTFIDTLGYSSFYGYSFRFGDGNKKRYKETRSFFSDLNSYNASTKILDGNAYHFYGKGDYPSYFGGAMIQKVYTPDVSDPPTQGEIDSEFGSASVAGSGFTAYINDNGEGSAFYQVVSDGTKWWVFSASAAQ